MDVAAVDEQQCSTIMGEHKVTSEPVLVCAKKRSVSMECTECRLNVSSAFSALISALSVSSVLSALSAD